MRWGKGGGEEEAGLVPTSHSGGRWQRGDIFPGAPRPALQGCSLLGNGGVLGTSEKNVQPQPQACLPKLSSLFAAAHPPSHSF